MEMVELQQGIQALPETAQSKPLLLEMVRQIKDLQNSQDHTDQDILALQRTSASQEAPVHTHGLCQDAACSTCTEQGRSIVKVAQERSRQAILAEFDTALEWAGGKPLQERVVALVKKWSAAGRPAPAAEPYYTIALEG